MSNNFFKFLLAAVVLVLGKDGSQFNWLHMVAVIVWWVSLFVL